MREASKNEIIREARKRHIPLIATFELTYRCNLRCVHCYLEEDTAGELTSPEVFSVIDQLADAGTLEVVFTGGEALVRDDFFDIAGYARKRNMAVSLMSNGILINEEAVEKIKQFHFRSVMISLYGVTPQTHEAITGVRGSLTKTVKAINLLRRNGLKVEVETPVMKQNVGEIARIDDFCNGIGVKLNASPQLSPATNHSLRPLKYRLGDEELRGYMLWEVGTGKKIAALTRTCNAGLSNVSISASGRVFPCNTLRLEAGDLRQESFTRIWSYSPIFQWIRNMRIADFTECFKCELLGACTRCPGHALNEEGDILAPCKEACRITRARQEVENEERSSSKEGKETVCQA